MLATDHRILVLSVTAGAGSGAERVLEYLLGALDQPLRSRLVVATPPDSQVGVISRSLGVETVDWPALAPSSFKHDAKAYLQFRRRVADLKISLIHGWHGRTFEWAALLAWQLGVPLVGTTHDHPWDPGYSPVRLAFMRHGAQRMRRLICVSQALASACGEAKWKVPVQVIRNGLPTKNFDSIRERATPGRKLRVAFLGSSEKKKGGALVFEAAKALPPDSVRWNLYGNQSASSPPEIKALSPTKSPQIVWHGLKPAAEIYRTNDAVFHPSLRFDPYPTVLMEAATAGLPVVATDVGGTREIVQHGQTGFLFSPDDPLPAFDSLRKLAADPGLLAHVGAAARAHALQHFGADEMAKNYTELWTKILNTQT